MIEFLVGFQSGLRVVTVGNMVEEIVPQYTDTPSVLDAVKSCLHCRTLSCHLKADTSIRLGTSQQGITYRRIAVCTAQDYYYTQYCTVFD